MGALMGKAFDDAWDVLKGPKIPEDDDGKPES